jgi:hypothetical protein
MTNSLRGGTATAHPTCRLRPIPATIAVRPGLLEIAHACRLRKRLKAAGADGLVVNVRGVGYRLVTPVLHQTQGRNERPLAA